jgi:hypothetical protein
MRVRLKKMDVFWLKASSFFRQLREVDSNRPNLPTRDREIGRVLVQAEGLAPAAFSRLRDVAGDARALASSAMVRGWISEPKALGT